jgi:hypothetical protein
MTLTAIRSTLTRFDQGDLTRRQLELLLSDDLDAAWDYDDATTAVDWSTPRSWLAQPDADDPAFENGGLLLVDLIGLDA